MAVFAWATVPAAGLFLAPTGGQTAQCGTLTATLTQRVSPGPTGGAPTANVGNNAPRGTARYRSTGKDRLQVDIRSMGLAAGTNLDVLINGTSVGTVALAKNGNGQLKVDAPTVQVEGASVISIQNAGVEVISGTFSCNPGGNTNTGANTNAGGNMNAGGNSTNMNMNSNGNATNMNMNMNMNSNANMNMNMNSNTTNGNTTRRTNTNGNTNANTTTNSNDNTNANTNTNSDTLTSPTATPSPRGR